MRSSRYLAAILGSMLVVAGAPGGTAHAAYPGDDGRIVVTVDGRTLLEMNADGSHRFVLIGAGGRASDPAWSPDGTKIAFVRHSVFGGGNRFALDVVDAIGHNRTAVVPPAAPRIESPTWSPDGSTLAYCVVSGSHSAVFTVLANGTDRTRISSRSHNDCDPSWSPDGTEIAVQTHLAGVTVSRIVTIHPDGTGRRIVVFSGFNYAPDWSPDSQRLTFIAHTWIANVGRTRDVWIVDRNGAALQDLTRSRRDEWTPAFSPSGLSIVYARDQGRLGVRTGLYVIPADGTGGPDRLLPHSGRVFLNPTWQPA